MKILINLFYLSGAEVFSKVLTFAAVAYLAHVSGPQYYGYVELAASILLCASLIIDQGFGPYGAREIAKSPSITGEITGEIITARLGLAFISFTVMAVFVWIVNYPPFVRQLALYLGLSLFISPFLLQWVFQGHSQMQVVSLLQIIRQSVYAAVIFLFIRNRSQLGYIVLAEIAAVSISVAYGILRYRKQFGGLKLFPLHISGKLFREGIPIGLSQLFWMVRMFGATVILGIFATGEAIGYFSSSMRILIALHAFVYLYYFNLLPLLSRTWNQVPAEITGIFDRSLRIVSWGSAIACAVWVLAAPIVVRAIYGSEFMPAVVSLQWLAGVCLVAALSGHYRFGLIAAGFQNLEMGTAIIGAIFAVVFLPLGYIVNPLSGPAIGLLITEIVVWFVAWGLAAKKMGVHGHARIIVKPLLATFLAGAFIGWVPGLSPILRVIILITVMVPLAFLLEPILWKTVRDFMLSWRQHLRLPSEKKTENVI